MSNEQPKPVPKAILSPIANVRFVESVPFMGTEASYAAVGPQHADSITPGRMEADGSIVSVGGNQRADGLLLQKLKPRLERVFVPWANIRGVVLSD